MRQVGIGLPLVATLLLGALPVGGQEDANGAVRATVLFDGPHSGNVETAELFETKIGEVAPTGIDVHFPSELTREGDHTLAGVAEALDRLLADPSVDPIVALGPLASYDMARPEWLAKPSAAAFALDPEVLGLPLADGTSGVPNLSYVAQATELRRDFQAFRDIVSFSNLTVLANPRWPDISGIGARANEAAQALGIELPVRDRECLGGSARPQTLFMHGDLHALTVLPSEPTTSSASRSDDSVARYPGHNGCSRTPSACVPTSITTCASPAPYSGSCRGRFATHPGARRSMVRSSSCISRVRRIRATKRRAQNLWHESRGIAARSKVPILSVLEVDNMGRPVARAVGSAALVISTLCCNGSDTVGVNVDDPLVEDPVASPANWDVRSNEPAGMTTLTDNRHTELTPDPWRLAMNKAGYDVPIIVTDETAPDGLDTQVLEQSYHGVPNMYTPRFNYASLRNSSEVYVSTIFKVDEGWLHPARYPSGGSVVKWLIFMTNTKMFFVALGGSHWDPYAGPNPNPVGAVWLIDYHRPPENLKVSETPLALVPIFGDTWYKVQVHAQTGATPRLRLWVNDVLVEDSDREGWNPQEGTVFQELQLGGTWGGGIGYDAPDQSVFYARTYISVR